MPRVNKRFLRLVLLLSFFISYYGFAQAPVKPKQPRILLLLDGSSSMLQPWNDGNERFKAAAKVISKLMDSIYSVNADVEFALRVYGHQHAAQENNCLDSRQEVRFSKNNLTQMELRLESLHPWGVSPIAYSIQRAAEDDMTDPANNSYSLILITDGGESCGGDICEVARKLLEKKISFRPYVLSLVDYAPLRQQYDCLGEYILVTKPGDIPPVVGKIVEAYRPMLTMAKIDSKMLQTAALSTPSAMKVTTPSFKLTTETTKEPEPPRPAPLPKGQIAALTINGKPRYLPQMFVTPSFRALRVPVFKVPAPEMEPPKPDPLPKDRIATLTINSRPRYLPQMYVTPSFRTLRLPVFKVPAPEVEPIPVPTATTVAVPPTPPTGPTKLVVPNTNKQTQQMRPMDPPPVTAAAKPKPSTPVKPAVAEPPKPKEAKHTVERQESKETTVEVYFTDGRGKFYSTTPQILLLDPKTNKLVNKFWRTVDGAGKPDPQKQIPPGTYNFTVANKGNVIVRNVEIKENTNNKVMIVVGKASLIFTYENNPTRPVSEYTAVVNRRFEPGPVIQQKCTVELEYEPGNFYIEVNTLPVLKRNLDLDFDYIYDLKIPEDGAVNFTNAEAVGKVQLYMPLGDKFLRFHTLEVPGSADGQKLKLQPGVYEAHFIRNPKLPMQQETVKRFFIKSNMITDLEL